MLSRASQENKLIAQGKAVIAVLAEPLAPGGAFRCISTWVCFHSLRYSLMLTRVHLLPADDNDEIDWNAPVFTVAPQPEDDPPEMVLSHDMFRSLFANVQKDKTNLHLRFFRTILDLGGKGIAALEDVAELVAGNTPLAALDFGANSDWEPPKKKQRPADAASAAIALEDAPGDGVAAGPAALLVPEPED